jgi:hypothetical protein
MMQRLSLTYFHDLGAALKPLGALQGNVPFMEVWSDLYEANEKLTSLLGTQWFWGALKSSWPLGSALRNAIQASLEAGDFSRTFEFPEAFAITSAFNAFAPVLRAELSVSDAYYVTSKGGYDTLALISNAEILFPEALGKKVEEATSEVREAGKCLAFELCTAAGIHVLRALELVLKRYFKEVTNGQPLPTNRNIGAYIRKMEELKVGDKKVLAVLRQIKDLHRNALFHPEDTLDKEGAINLFGIVNSAISAMLREIPFPPEQLPMPLEAQPEQPA